MAATVSRLTASGGPRTPGSCANTNNGASALSRDFNAGAMLILTVASADAEAPGDVIVPAGDEFVPATAVPGALPVSKAPGGPNSANLASSIASIFGGGCRFLSACQRLRAPARSPRTAAAKPPYSSAFG